MSSATMNPSSSSSSGPPIPAALSLPPGTSIASQGDYEPPLSPMQSHPGSPTPGSPELLAQDNRKGSASAGLAVPLNGWALGSVDDDDSHSSLGGEEEKEKKDVKVKEEKVAAGTQDDKVYEYLMPAWRYRIRKFLTRNVEFESGHLARLQETVRNPALDKYFVYTSILGTHTFFMIFLPLFWWFGYPSHGRGLLYVLAAGVFASSYIKDLFCVPRPFSPPVVRLTVGSHAQEYGFPSTHSTNSVSMALFLGEVLWMRLRDGGEDVGWVEEKAIWVGLFGLAFYAVSVVGGRLYCGMHSVADCVAGSLLGATIWYTLSSYRHQIDAFTGSSGWTVPLTVIPLGLYLVSSHPEPVDDCPCFEDAIAFVAVAMGIMMAHWFHGPDYPVSITYGSWSSPLDTALWFGFAIAKVVIGVGGIFLWRLVAKEVFHAILPPIFRTISPFLILPRRHYTPASDYHKYKKNEGGLHPIPSLLNLPGVAPMESAIDDAVLIDEESGNRGKNVQLRLHGSALSNRVAGGLANGTPMAATQGTNSGVGAVEPAGENTAEMSWDEKKARALGNGYGNGSDVNAYYGGDEKVAGRRLSGDVVLLRKEKPKHYDADVLTKVFVYSGIGYLASCGLTEVHRIIGLSV